MTQATSGDRTAGAGQWKRFVLLGSANGPWFVYDRKQGISIRQYVVRANAVEYVDNRNRQVEQA